MAGDSTSLEFWVFPAAPAERHRPPPPVLYVPGQGGGADVVRRLVDELPLVSADRRPTLLALLDLLRRRHGPQSALRQSEPEPNGFSYAFQYRAPAVAPLGPLLLDNYLAGAGKGKPTELSLRPVARAVAGAGGVAVASPVGRAVLRRGQHAAVDYEPDAVAIAGPGGRAHSHPTLAIDYIDDDDNAGGHGAAAVEETLSYYGGAKGHYLVVGADGSRRVETHRKRPTVKPPAAPPKEDDEDVGMAPDEEGVSGGAGGGEDSEDSVAVGSPPANASFAEAKPIAIAIAGVGGSAKAAPVGQAVVGDYSEAIARPVGIAMAGVRSGGVPGAIAVPADRVGEGATPLYYPRRPLADTTYYYY